jgi:hypothetical protein
MKKTLLMAVIGVTLTGFISAQQGWGPQWGRNPGYSAQPVTVTGNLQLQNGVIAVVNTDQVYYVPGLERLTGFIDGIKEDAQVSVEGFLWNNYGSAFVQPVKLTINGKSYDLQQNTFAMGPRHGYGWGNAGGRGSWCH